MTVSEINKKFVQKLNIERQVCDDYRRYLHGLLTEYIKDIEELSQESIIADLPITLIHNQLVAEIKKIGIHTTDNFIIFHCDHDQSDFSWSYSMKKAFVILIIPETV